MKYRLTFLIFVILFLSIFSTNIFVVEETIYTDDNRLSLKDFFNDISFDRTINYLYNDEYSYTKEEIRSKIEPFLNIYFNDFSLVFKSDIITIKKYVKKNNSKSFDFFNYFIDFISENYPKITPLKIVKEPNVDDVNNIEIINNFLNKDNLFLSIKYESNGITKFSSLKIKVEKLKKIIFAEEQISRGYTLKADNTYEATINVLEYNFKTATIDDITLGKYKVTKNFEKDEPINQTYLKIIPDVLKGDLVNIFVDYNGIKVQSIGKALKDSVYGQTITLTNIETDEIITGILKEGPSVFINLGGE
ncbi:MAG: flagellar basal body P-ring formation chaperone FlgA [Thermotogota bacterium]